MAVPLHILVVEDDKDIREAVVSLLELEGHRPVEAANGQLALEALAAGPRFDAIILDLAMPVMDGVTFLAHKSKGAHSPVPVVVFSSSMGEVQVDGHAGVTSVVRKLAGIDGLLAALAGIVSGSRKPIRSDGPGREVVEPVGSRTIGFRN